MATLNIENPMHLSILCCVLNVSSQVHTKNVTTEEIQAYYDAKISTNTLHLSANMQGESALKNACHTLANITRECRSSTADLDNTLETARILHLIICTLNIFKNLNVKRDRLIYGTQEGWAYEYEGNYNNELTSFKEILITKAAVEFYLKAKKNKPANELSATSLNKIDAEIVNGFTSKPLNDDDIKLLNKAGISDSEKKLFDEVKIICANLLGTSIPNKILAKSTHPFTIVAPGNCHAEINILWHVVNIEAKTLKIDGILGGKKRACANCEAWIENMKSIFKEKGFNPKTAENESRKQRGFPTNWHPPVADKNSPAFEIMDEKKDAVKIIKIGDGKHDLIIF